MEREVNLNTDVFLWLLIDVAAFWFVDLIELKNLQKRERGRNDNQKRADGLE